MWRKHSTDTRRNFIQRLSKKLPQCRACHRPCSLCSLNGFSRERAENHQVQLVSKLLKVSRRTCSAAVLTPDTSTAYVTLVWTLPSKGSLPHVLRIRLIVIVELLLSVLWSWWWPYLTQTCDIPVIQCNPKTVMPKYILQLSYIVFVVGFLIVPIYGSHKAWFLIG